MGIFFSVAHALGWMMARRSAEPQRFLPSTPCGPPLPSSESCGGPAMSVMHPHEDDEIVLLVCDTSGPVHITNNLKEKQPQEVTEDPSPSEGISVMKRVTSMLTKNSSKKTVMKLESDLKEKTTLIDKLKTSLRAKDDSLQGLKIDLARARRDKQETLNASGKEVQRHIRVIEEKEKALEDANLHTSQWKTKYQKLEAQLALIEQKAAQESLTSGSYPDDHANPGMLEVASKAVDKATEDLARVLHGMSVTKALPLNSVELEHFVRQISPARPAEFSRPIQVRYVWGHWICFHMFQGFEHVFFDVDGGQLTSPLDSKKHALECFRSFQQKQSVSSSDSYGIFQAFCSWKYRNLFPQWLANQANLPNGIVCNEYGLFNGDGEIYDRFMDVARAVWLLHELAFSFDPPASILRMARGTPYDKQFHEPVIHVEGGDGMSQMVTLMIRPAFRVRKSIIRSRVFCANPNTDV